MKKKWKKPKLVVLVRGKPEEAVLLYCKTDIFQSDGPDVLGGVINCLIEFPPLGFCSDPTDT